jgi:hypothetical protein
MPSSLVAGALAAYDRVAVQIGAGVSLGSSADQVPVPVKVTLT